MLISTHPLYVLFFPLQPPPPRPTLFPYTTLFRSRATRSALAPSRVHTDPDSPYIVSLARRIASASSSNGITTDRKSTRLNSSHQIISYAVFCLKKKKKENVRARSNPEPCILLLND